MLFKRILSFVEYTNFLLKKYNELKLDQEDNIYRIVEIEPSSAGKHKLTVQIIGKSVVFHCAPQEIVTNDRILEGFSKQDIKTITYLAFEQSKKPKYEIIMQEFCDTFNLNKVKNQNMKL